jgi:DNA polymerase-3 subunit gamma/tau
MAKIAQREGFTVEPAALTALARLAGGSMRDAETLFDQAITFCGKEIREKDVLGLYNLPGEGELEALRRALLRRDSDEALATAERWHELGIDLQRALTDLQESLRRALMEVPTEERTRTMEILRTLQSHGRTFPFAVSGRAAFAVALLEAIENSRRRPIGRILEELTR